jgi:hypothetical protein
MNDIPHCWHSFVALSYAVKNLNEVFAQWLIEHVNIFRHNY